MYYYKWNEDKDLFISSFIPLITHKTAKIKPHLEFFINFSKSFLNPLDISKFYHYIGTCLKQIIYGEMAEWSKAVVLKTTVG